MPNSYQTHHSPSMNHITHTYRSSHIFTITIISKQVPTIQEQETTKHHTALAQLLAQAKGSRSSERLLLKRAPFA